MLKLTKRMIEGFEAPLNERLEKSNDLVGDPRIKRTIAARAATLNEHVIRQFIQKEGMRVNLQVPKNARERIEELEEGN